MALDWSSGVGVHERDEHVHKSSKNIVSFFFIENYIAYPYLAH
jgi:hypothetical protein